MRNSLTPMMHPSPFPGDSDPSPKRPRVTRKLDSNRPDSVPVWLHDAASAFVDTTPPLSWAGGFYSWGTWLEQLCNRQLWIRSGNPGLDPPWRALIDACRVPGQVCGTAALYRAKSDLVNAIINFVFRRGEQQRLSDDTQHPAEERDILRRVRAVVTRQRRHEGLSLTLIRFLDLAFVLSAYKDCRLAMATPETRAAVDRHVEDELLLFDGSPSARDIRAVTTRMQTFMWQQRWLPWYEQIPGVRGDMVIRTREAAMAFCDKLPYPQLHVRAGVRGLSRDHIAGAGSMNEWLLSLFHPRFIPKWALLAKVYEVAVREGHAEEESLLEETARRVVERVLEPLTEVDEVSDPTHSKLVDAAPGIVVTQSVRIEGRFTFRQLLELYVHLSMFGGYLHSQFYGCTLPSIEQIQSGIVFFEEIKTRLLEIRPLIDSSRVDRLYEWCLATTESHSRDGHSSLAAYGGCIAYQHAAIRAALGPCVMLLPSRRKPSPSDEVQMTEADPLVFAAIIAEWDAPLAARIVDASVRIGRSVRNKFQNGKGDGLDLYTHRRVTVCDAALDRFRDDRKMAARIMSRLHPVWDECENDKNIGVFDGRGAIKLKMAVDKGNFEAASVFGLLLCSNEWEERRHECGLQRDMEAGFSHICKAIAMGDTAAAADLLHLLRMSVIDDGTFLSQRDQNILAVPRQIIMNCIKCLKETAKYESSMSLFLGYLYTRGAPGMNADCQLAIKEYEKVLLSNTTTTRYRGFAANNLGVLKSLMYTEDQSNNSGSVSGGSGGGNSTLANLSSITGGASSISVVSGTGGANGNGAAGSGNNSGSNEELKANDYFKIAASAGIIKATSNLAAVLCHTEKPDGHLELAAAADLYGRVFHSPEGDSPVTVIQTDCQGSMHIFEVAVRRDQQPNFCQHLDIVRSYGTALHKYGKILKQENLPYVVVMNNSDSKDPDIRHR